MVNDCFLGERNEEIEVFAQALLNKLEHTLNFVKYRPLIY